MTTRLLTVVTLSVVLVAALSGTAFAQAAQPAQAKPEGVFTIGGTYNDVSGNLDRLGEYEVFKKDATPQVGAQVWGKSGTYLYDLLADFSGDARDQKYSARVVGPRVKASFSFDRFLHRLDHDPLTYIGSAISTFVVRATDTDPGAKHVSTNGIWNASVEVAATDHLRLFASHHVQMRDGTRQVMAMSHCANCHIKSYTRELDETMQEVKAGARFTKGRLNMDYTLANRTLEEKAPDLTNVYDNALHPQTALDVFLNRVSYDEGSGPLVFEQTPKFSKTTHTIRAAFGLPGDGAVSGNFTHSKSTNDSSDFGMDFTGLSGRATLPLGRRAMLKAYFRRYEIDTDSVFVDIAEPTAPAGPHAGLTYAQAYPTFGSPDYWTHSAASRTPTEAVLELSYRPDKKTSLNVGYMYEQIAREAYEVEKTTTNRFKATARYRPTKQLNLRARFDYSDITNPFAYLKAAKPAILQPEPTPGAVPFPGLQYFAMYDSRSVDLSSFPSSSALGEGGMTWSPSARVALSAHYRYKSMTNDTLSGAKWTHQIHLPGVELWLAPTDRVTLSAGWGYQRDTLDTVFSTLNFVG